MYMSTICIIGIISRGKNEGRKNIINKQYYEKIKKEQFDKKTVSKYFWYRLLYPGN